MDFLKCDQKFAITNVRGGTSIEARKMLSIRETKILFFSAIFNLKSEIAESSQVSFAPLR